MRFAIAFVICHLSFVIAVAAQNRGVDQQNDNIRRAKQRLEEIERLATANAQNASASERELSLARNEIGARREIVQGLETQTALISDEITADQRRVNELDARLARLKKEYAAYIRSAWKTAKATNATTFLLAARDFNDAVRRIAFLRRYNRVRAEKGAEIARSALSLKTEIARLNENKNRLGELRSESQNELTALSRKEKDYAQTLDALAKDRKKLESDAVAERAKIVAAQQQIDRIMAQLAAEAAAAAAAEKARAERERRLSTSAVLDGRFEENRGRLPWPVGGPGAVLDRFGANTMPDGIVKNSKGITIATQSGAPVRAVFEGAVSGVYKRPEFGMCVVVLTGGYMVLYANLAEANVATGEKIALGQQVGRVADSDSADAKKVMFQIWKGTTAIDPLIWLRK